jgi:ATP-dependent RNA helicase RhlE
VAELAAGLLTDPVRVAVPPPSTTVERVDQRVLFVERADKPELLRELFRDGDLAKAIVFTRTKHGANKVAERLAKAGVAAEAIHGNKSQNARQRALDAFKAGRVRALVATDIAARGLDVEAVSHVINFELPDEPEAYVHRIGRTARAGRAGTALSFCEAEEVGNLREVERAIRQPVPQQTDHPYHADSILQMYRTGRGGTTKGRGAGGGAPSAAAARAGAGGATTPATRAAASPPAAAAPAPPPRAAARLATLPAPFSPPRSPAGASSTGSGRPAFGSARPAYRSGSR